MGDRWIVFGGWAISPEILRPVFGKESTYVDINEIMPLLFNDEELIENWVDIIKERVTKYLLLGIEGIAGWSTGAMIACALAKQVPSKKLVLLSGTPSFCRRQGFRFGQKPSIVKAMIHKLQEKGNGVVGEFLLGCGLQENESFTKEYDKQSLIKGLMFLEKINLIPAIKKTQDCAVIFHGSDDRIIPYEAGKRLAAMIGADLFPFSGQHAFFLEHCGEIKRKINDLFSKSPASLQ